MTASPPLLLLLTLLVTSSAWADDEPSSLTAFYEAQFKAFPAPQGRLKAKAPLQWKNPEARKYRTRLKEAWAEAKEPNFAGHYFVPDNIGCGTGCLVVFVVDWNTGAILSSPEHHYFEVRKDSRLMILKAYDACTAYGPPLLLEFTGGRFREVKHDQCTRL
jgi:hypothetical protein